ncbi:MAG: M50 family metallopeptidase [Nanoarchaeota archaeon]|nr:M50 family metallopeptidase [Nanoarchaeota archaeon]
MITLIEIFSFLILIVSIAYIFSMNITNDFKKNLKISLIATSPAVFFHELFHKIFAISFGYAATFHIFTPGLILGVILKLVNSPFLIIAPGFVSISNVTNDLQYRLIAFAGPFANLLLFLTALLILKYKDNLSEKQLTILHLTKRINLLLLIFNMIPISPLDGAKVLFGLS